MTFVEKMDKAEKSYGRQTAENLCKVVKLLLCSQRNEQKRSEKLRK